MSGGPRQLFESRFGRSPDVAASAPGRVNLIGEHTDYNDGFVLPMAIDRRATVLAAAASPGRPSTLVAADLGEEVSLDLTAPIEPRPACFSNYVAGVVDGLAHAGATPVNVDLLLTSTVPVGAGLSSSAAVSVAAATALEQLLGVPMSGLERAMICRRAEHEFAGTPCGLMDQLVAVGARAGAALLIDCRSLEIEPIPMPPEDRAAVIVADTGVRHELAATEYAERRRACHEAAELLQVGSLRVVNEGEIDGADLSATRKNRVRHVVRENARTRAAARALAVGDLDRVGALMLDSHDSLRDLFEVSCLELDALVDAAAELRGAGVYGARMTGGGFGGCVVVLCHADASDAVVDRLRGAANVFRARPGGPASVIT